MMMSVPNGKVLSGQERHALQVFLDSAHPVRVVCRRDSVELHVQPIENTCGDSFPPDVGPPEAGAPPATAMPSNGMPLGIGG
jgi:hypothetical protein